MMSRGSFRFETDRPLAANTIGSGLDWMQGEVQMRGHGIGLPQNRFPAGKNRP